MAFSITELGGLLPKRDEGMAAFTRVDEPKPESSFLWKALDAANKPYSATMGAFTGLLGGETGPIENVKQALTGERSFSALDAAGAMGVDTTDPKAQWLAVAADVVNPLDPLNYVTLGFNKAGRVARGVALADKMGDAAKTTRVAAAEAGNWNPASFMGVGLVPKPLAVKAAGGMDALAEKADRFSKTNRVLKHFGGLKRVERDNPDLVTAIRDIKGAAALDENAYTAAMSRAVDSLRKAGNDEDQVRSKMTQVFDLLESEATRLARSKRELEQIDNGTWRNPLLPYKTEQDIAEEAASFAEDQARVVARKAEAVDDTTSHVLDAVTVSPDDPAPPEFMLRRREKLQADIQLAETLREGVAPDILNMADELADWREVMQDKYSVIRKYDPNFEFPIEDYMPHILPHNATKREKRIMAEAAQKETARRTELAGKGYSDEVIERMLSKEFRSERALMGTQISGEELRGQIPAANRRKYDMTAKEARAAREAGEYAPEWNENAALVLDTANMHATRWRLAHDAHEKLVEMGQTVTRDEFLKLDAVKQREYVPMDFKVPWVESKKNPFHDRYMTRESYDLMRRELGAANFFTGRAGQSGLMEALHKIRHQYVSWTLGPFPATHARNFASDIVQGFLGGLNPVTDLAAAPSGNSAYMTALAIAARNAHTPLLDKNRDFANLGLTKILDTVNSKFGAQLDADGLMQEMRKRRILGDSTLRDDMELMIEDSLLMQDARKNRSGLAKLGDWLSPNADKNKLVQTGFKIGSKQQDYTRSALFIHALKEGMGDAENLDAAMTYAEAQVRKHLFDYGDLTSFERDVMRLIIPFYTFTSKNLPMQIEKTITDPGKQAWVNRAFQGMWAGTAEDEELNYEDLPDWMQNSMAIPIRKMKDKDGRDVWSVSTMRGWLPQTELNELADAMRGEKFLGFFAERMNPAFKEFFEQTMNYDSFLGRKIDDGQTVEMFGFAMNPRTAHLIRNVRLFNELDKMNPLDMWTSIWEKYGAKEGSGRPHRREAPGKDRAVRQMTGLNFYTVDAEKEAVRRVNDNMREIGRKKSQARLANKFGQTLERDSLIEQIETMKEETRAAQRRVNQLRRDRAEKIARQSQ